MRACSRPGSATIDCALLDAGHSSDLDSRRADVPGGIDTYRVCLLIAGMKTDI